MANGKAATHGERIVKLEEGIKQVTKIAESVTKIEDIIVPLNVKFESLLTKVNDHHIDIKVIKPLAKNNGDYISALKKAGCPQEKVTLEYLDAKDKTEKTQRYRFYTIVVALLGILATLLIEFH